MRANVQASGAGEISESSGGSHAPLSLSKIGPYVLGKVLGRGRTGITYEGAHVAQGRKVAIKLLDKKHLGDAPVSRQDALFAREAMILAQLPRHPGVINVLDAGVAHDLPYIVTEFVEGQSFAQWIRLRRSDLRTMVRVIRDVARAIHHAHENGILHRNLKPSNILVDESGRAYVTDLGSAKHLDTEQNQSTLLFAGTVVGSPSYMSPELAAGLKTVDRRTDVYSLGAILYEVLTGKPPYVGGSTVADLISLIQGQIEPPSGASPEWAPRGGQKSIDEICMSALKKTPEGRLPSAMAFADALSAWLGDAPEAKPRCRKSWFWGLGVLVVTGLATLGALFRLVRHEA